MPLFLQVSGILGIRDWDDKVIPTLWPAECLNTFIGWTDFYIRN